MTYLYHLDLDENKIKGAKIALLPGDPFRSEIIAENLDKNYGEIAWKREYCSYLGDIKGVKIVVISTGIGGPSTSIAIDELSRIGVQTFIRVGTTGSIQEFINIGDVIITSGSVRLDGASTHYAPIEYPAIAHHEVLYSLIEGAKRANLRFHVGITASTDTFYPGQERESHVLRRFQGMTDEFKRLNVLNYEMESSTLLVVCSVLKLKGGCVTGVINSRTSGDKISEENLKIGETNAIKTAIKGTEIFIDSFYKIL